MNKKGKCETIHINEIKGRVSATCFMALNEWMQEGYLKLDKQELLTTWLSEAIRELSQEPNCGKLIKLPEQILKQEENRIIQIFKVGVEKHGFVVEHINCNYIKVYKTTS
ncbi:MAG: hypothetical protein PHR25_02515 [Clostridia bacterium]|nr:hypothetical protein [Clostridia bacterium]MDD4375632.1 hypothetical protein [Clostridia bacterium]